jgi:hypothetical protein
MALLHDDVAATSPDCCLLSAILETTNMLITLP